MALPKLSLPVHSIELPISKETIQFNPFVVKEEKNLLTTLDTNNKEEVVKLFKMLVSSCVLNEGFDFTEMNMVDFFYLLIYIRMKSNSEIIEGSLPCEHCEKKTQFEANLEDSLKIINPDTPAHTVQVNDQLSLEIGPVKIDSFFSGSETNLIDIVANSIKTVVYDNKVYDEFTVQELKENILFSMTQKDFEPVADGIKKLTSLEIQFSFVCVNCGKTNNFKTDDVVNFF